MALARHPVQHHARDQYGGVVERKAFRDRGSGLRLAGNVEHEQHRQPVEAGKIGGSARASGLGRDAVEQAHRALDDDEVGAVRAAAGEGGEQVGMHRPGIEIDAGPAGRRGMEAGVDIVRSRLGAAHHDAAPREGA